MKKNHRELLKRRRSYLVENIQPKAMIDQLVESGLFNDEDSGDYSALDKQSTLDQVRFIIDRLPRKGPSAFGTFLQLLKTKQQEYIAEELLRDLKREEEAKKSSRVVTVSVDQENDLKVSTGDNNEIKGRGESSCLEYKEIEVTGSYHGRAAQPKPTLSVRVSLAGELYSKPAKRVSPSVSDNGSHDRGPCHLASGSACLATTEVEKQEAKEKSRSQVDRLEEPLKERTGFGKKQETGKTELEKLSMEPSLSQGRQISKLSKKVDSLEKLVLAGQSAANRSVNALATENREIRAKLSRVLAVQYSKFHEIRAKIQAKIEAKSQEMQAECLELLAVQSAENQENRAKLSQVLAENQEIRAKLSQVLAENQEMCTMLSRAGFGSFRHAESQET